MRFAWLAAAAASICASQADAARYFEFIVIGRTGVTFHDPATGVRQDVDVASTVTAAFDTFVLPPRFAPYDALGPDISVSLFIGNLRLFTSSPPGGTFFSLSSPGAVLENGNEFRDVTVVGSFGFTLCSGGSCTDTPGSLTSFRARTTDTAPTSLGATEQVVLTAVPEPATWMLMLAGIGAIGSVLRRRWSTRSPSVRQAGRS